MKDIVRNIRNSLRYNRKTNILFITIIHYVGNVFCVAPFYDFKNETIKWPFLMRMYAICHILLYIFGFCNTIMHMNQFVLNGNMLHDILAPGQYIFITSTTISSILMFTLIHPQNYVNLMKTFRRIEGNFVENNLGSYNYLLEFVAGNTIVIIFCIYEYPTWSSFNTPLWFELWDFLLSFSEHIMIYLMYNLALAIKYRYQYLIKIIENLSKCRGPNIQRETDKIIEIYYGLAEIVDTFNKLFQLPFLCYVMVFTLIVFHLINVVFTANKLHAAALSAFEMVS